jgi:hypothetical protein
MVAGSSEMYIYFKHIEKMYQFGPYGPNHATAATFAFRREFLKHSCYEDGAALAEERHFLKNYTVPFVQLDSLKTILVFSHIHNSFDKKKLLEDQNINTNANPYVKLSSKTVDDFIKEQKIKDFFMKKIERLLDTYEPGRPENKPEVLKQIKDITEKREKMMHDQQQQQHEQMIKEGPKMVPLTPEIIKQLQSQGAPPELIHQLHMQGGVQIQAGPLPGQIQMIMPGQQAQPQLPQPQLPQQNQISAATNDKMLQQYESRFAEQHNLIQTLMKENIELKDRVAYLEENKTK